jgi:hypothetical protein
MSQPSTNETIDREPSEASSSAAVMKAKGDGPVAILTHFLDLGPSMVVEVDSKAGTYAIRIEGRRPLLVQGANAESIDFLSDQKTVSVFERYVGGSGFLYFERVPVEHVRIS